MTFGQCPVPRLRFFSSYAETLLPHLREGLDKTKAATHLEDGTVLLKHPPLRVVPPNHPMPPASRTDANVRVRVSLDDQQRLELQRLRYVEHWSVKKLAKHFNCSPVYISIIAPSLPDGTSMHIPNPIEDQKKWSS